MAGRQGVWNSVLVVERNQAIVGVKVTHVVDVDNGEPVLTLYLVDN